eukprot:gb/GECG01004489.1/.p1 GENE.gb/GECG01004489.1/~~gb/GECG01004489.1/.p1  ORF type:complete len:193 (+),score=19.26 gb/GECG01004489.1/:1-579(+)
MPFFLQLLPLLSLQTLPLIGLGLGAAGAYYGAYDLSYKAAYTVLYPVIYKQGKKTADDQAHNQKAKRYGFLTGMATGLGFVSIRELFFLPHMPPAPQLPVEDQSLQLTTKVQNAWTMARHTIKHYPYKFRAINVFAAGTLAGLAHLVGEQYYISSHDAASTANDTTKNQNTQPSNESTSEGNTGSKSSNGHP